jgi:type I restriction enzyme, S subunit
MEDHLPNNSHIDRDKGSSIDAFRDTFHVNWVEQEDIGQLITAQSYRPEILEAIHAIKTVSSYKTLNEACNGKIIPGRGPKYSSSGVSCLKTKNVQSILVDPNTDDYVSIEYAMSNHKLRIPCGSVLMNLSGAGSLGRVGIYLKKDLPMTNQHLVRFEIAAPNDAAFIATFLSTWWGKRAIEQGISGSTGQLWINQDQLREIPVPFYHERIQQAIGNKIRKAERLRELAKFFLDSSFSQMENALMALGVKGVVIDSNSVDAERDSYHSTFIKSNVLDHRLNASAYRPNLISVIENLSTTPLTKSLQEISKSKIHQGATPVFADKGQKCLKTKNILGVFLDEEDTEFVSYDFVSNNPRSKIYTNTILINRQGAGSIGRCGVYLGAEPIWISDSLFKVELKDEYDPCYVSLFLSSWTGKRLIERGIQGSTGQLSLAQEHVQNLPIPIIDKDIQTQIGDKVRAAYKSRISVQQYIKHAKSDIESLIDGTLDEDKLLAEGEEIEQWLKDNPSPYEMERKDI